MPLFGEGAQGPTQGGIAGAAGGGAGQMNPLIMAILQSGLGGMNQGQGQGLAPGANLPGMPQMPGRPGQQAGGPGPQLPGAMGGGPGMAGMQNHMAAPSPTMPQSPNMMNSLGGIQALQKMMQPQGGPAPFSSPMNNSGGGPQTPSSVGSVVSGHGPVGAGLFQQGQFAPGALQGLGGQVAAQLGDKYFPNPAAGAQNIPQTLGGAQPFQAPGWSSSMFSPNSDPLAPIPASWFQK